MLISERYGDRWADQKITVSAMDVKAKCFVQILLCMGFLFVLSACVSNTTVRQHPEFQARRAAVITLMLVPPDVEVIRGSSQRTGQQLPEESMKATQDLRVLLAAELSHRGFNVEGQQPEDAMMASPTEQLAPRSSIKRMYAELALAMYGREPMPESRAIAYRYTLGPEIVQVAKQAATDALVFVQLRVAKRSSGDIAAETAKKVLIGLLTLGMFVPPKDASGWATLQMALIDGATGDVLWGNKVGDVSFRLIGEPDFDLKDMVADLLKPFPQ